MSKIVYFYHYYDVGHSFLYGDFSAYKRTPNRSWKKYSGDMKDGFNLLKNFKNLAKEEEISPLMMYPEKQIDFVLFESQGDSQNLKILFCNFPFF